MANSLIDLGGRQKFLEGGIAYLTDTIKAQLLDLATAGTANKLITSVTGAVSPITCTSAAHGFSNGQIVVVGGVGGNLAANQLAKLANVTANTFDLQTLHNSLAMTGSGAYTSGGYVFNLDLAQWLSDANASAQGAAVTLAGKTSSLGVANATAWTHSAVVVGANPIRAFILYKDTGVAGTSPVFLFDDGKFQVEVDAAAALNATSIVTLPLPGGIPNGTVLTFSNGVSATLTAAGNFGDRALTVSAIAAGIVAGHTADVTSTNANLPSPTNGTMNVQITPDAVSGYGLFRL